MPRLLFTATLVIVCSAAAIADVRVDEKTQVKFAGAMGRVVNFFGGSATRDGVISTVAVKGDRKATRSDSNGQVIDLREEKVYDIDFKDKSYRVTTFAEIRRQMEEARKKATEQAQQAQKEAGAAPQPASNPNDVQVEIDFNVKESGQRREINGYNAREIVMTIAVREKGKTLEQSGGMMLTSNTWLAPKIAAMDEVAAFDLRYAKQLNVLAMFDAQQMAALMAMYPMMKPAMERFEKENVNMDGTAVLTVATLDAVASAEQMKEQQQQQQQSSTAQAPPTSIGGIGGALGGRLGRRVLGGNQKPDAAPAASTPGRTTIMTMTDEVVKVTPSVADADVAIPAGFKQKS